MKTITIGNEGNQTLQVPFENETINLNIRYLQTQNSWSMNLVYQETTINGVAMTTGALLLKNNLPFDFIVEDNTKNGFDPYDSEDFSQGRCTLFLLEREDLIQVRGFDV